MIKDNLKNNYQIIGHLTNIMRMKILK